MNQTMKLVKTSEIRKAGTEALVKALGPIGMARYLEEYDNGGQGDYTKEKYEQQDYSIEEILAVRKALAELSGGEKYGGNEGQRN